MGYRTIKQALDRIDITMPLAITRVCRAFELTEFADSAHACVAFSSNVSGNARPAGTESMLYIFSHSHIHPLLSMKSAPTREENHRVHHHLPRFTSLPGADPGSQTGGVVDTGADVGMDLQKRAKAALTTREIPSRRGADSQSPK